LQKTGYKTKKSENMETKIFDHSKKLRFSELAEFSTEGITSKKIIQKKAGSVTLFAFDKGQGLSEHTAPFDALVQVLDGKARITIDGKPFELETGDSIIMPANVPHAVDAVDRFRMLLTMIREQ
jgi:quercetin dioxygenase-like cupin family protein